MRFSAKLVPSIKTIELVAYAIIWGAVLIVPLFIEQLYNVVLWNKVFYDWVRILSFLFIFLLNTYFLVPKVLIPKRYLIYTVTILMLIFMTTGVNLIVRSYYIKKNQQIEMPPMSLGQGMPPMELGKAMPVPMGYRLPQENNDKPFLMVLFENLLINVLVLISGTAIKMTSQWLNEENMRKDIEKEQLKTELALLRNQVSPHFFMNTLNNIHALVDINTEIAKNAIIKLSTLMRYLLYDTSRGKTTLKKEIEFIESFVSLMELRYSKKVTISVNLPSEVPDIQIYPMLFVSFLENAFKYGVSYQNTSFVNCDLKINDHSIFFQISNSKQINKDVRDSLYSGIGLTNIQKSLDLLYKNEYILKIHDLENEFLVQLTIPVYASNKMYSH